jgi:hypothetical protein
MRYGAAEFMTKPVDFNFLKAQLRRLSLRPVREELRQPTRDDPFPPRQAIEGTDEAAQFHCGDWRRGGMAALRAHTAADNAGDRIHER